MNYFIIKKIHFFKYRFKSEIIFKIIFKKPTETIDVVLRSLKRKALISIFNFLLLLLPFRIRALDDVVWVLSLVASAFRSILVQQQRNLSLQSRCRSSRFPFRGLVPILPHCNPIPFYSPIFQFEQCLQVQITPKKTIWSTIRCNSHYPPPLLLFSFLFLSSFSVKLMFGIV